MNVPHKGLPVYSTFIFFFVLLCFLAKENIPAVYDFAIKLLSSDCQAQPQAELEEIPKKKLPSEAKEAAKQLLKSISIPSTSVVRFVGPVKPGTLIDEKNPVPGGQIARLEVPSEPGTYYVFFIDDAPAFMFAHPVRYAWVNTKTGEVQTVDARWRPKISEPDMPPSRFRPSSSETIDKVLFIFGERAEAGTKE